MLRISSSKPLVAILISVAVVGSFAVAWESLGRAQSGADDAAEKLAKLNAKGEDTVVVATVNGVDVPRRAVDVTVAMSSIPGVGSSSGQPLAALSPQGVLSAVIDSILLAQLAEVEGVSVTDAEVSLMIKSGITDPLNDKAFGKDYEKALRESLKAMGTTPDEAPEDAELRAAYRRFLLIQRHASSSGDSREVRLARAHEGADVVTYPERLDEPR